MWKLTIYQIKKYETFECEQTVVFVDDNINKLLHIVSDLSERETETKTWYVIEESEE